MMLSTLASIALALSPSLPLPVAPTTPVASQEPVRYMGRAFLFEADLDAARAAGWCAADVEEEALLDGIAASIERRLRSTGRFVEAFVDREPERRFAVVFVGPQASSIEDMIVRGLSLAGRVEVGPVATASALAAAGVSLEEERARLAAWRAEHPETPVARFNGVPRDEGGPHGALRWYATGHGQPPLPLLRAGVHRFARAEMAAERPLETIVHPEREDAVAVRVHLNEAGARALRDALAPFAGGDLATVVDDRVIGVRPLEPVEESSFDLYGDLDRAEVRSLLWSLCAEPYGAPLRFIGFGKRELRGVAESGE